jgi:hypothetical protein
MSFYKIVKTKNSLIDDFYLYKIVSASVHYSIPFDERNVDYREYLDWIKEGNVPIEEEI